MYVVNTLKLVMLNGNVFIHLKQQFYSLKNVPNARVAYVLLHEINHIYNISYIAVLQGVNSPNPPLEIRGLT